MRKLLGYLCHLASTRLHRAAIALTGIDDGFCTPPIVTHEELCRRCNGTHEVDTAGGRDWCDCCGGCTYEEVTLPDVAPRLAAAIEAVGDRIQHAKWLAGIVGLERMTRTK